MGRFHRRAIISCECPNVRGDPQTRRATVESWLVHDLVVRFAGRILQVDQEVADRWGRLTGKAKAENRLLSGVEGLLAATAFKHNLTLVTRNPRDVMLSGVPVFNPWQS